MTLTERLTESERRIEDVKVGAKYGGHKRGDIAQVIINPTRGDIARLLQAKSASEAGFPAVRMLDAPTAIAVWDSNAAPHAAVRTALGGPFWGARRRYEIWATQGMVRVMKPPRYRIGRFTVAVWDQGTIVEPAHMSEGLRNLLGPRIDTVQESWDSEPDDWRAWITANGELEEVVGDVTHAEYVYGEFDTEDNEDDVDAALSHALDAGWIRVGINHIDHEFFATCDAAAVTRASLLALSRILDTHYAAHHTLDVSDTFYRGRARIKTVISRLLRTAK